MVLAIALDNPAFDQKRIANELNQRGIIIPDGGARTIWQRINLATFRKRLKALEEKVANEVTFLNEEQLVALERAKGESCTKRNRHSAS